MAQLANIREEDCFFGHEYDPFLGTSIITSYAVGGIVSQSGTAVVRIHTQDGGVIAADGLRRTKDGLQINDKQQKMRWLKSRGIF